MYKLFPRFKTLLFTVLSVTVLFLVSCSVKKNNILSREYHKTLAHYNGYFNARERIKQGAKTIYDAQIDRYDRILSVFKYGDPVSVKAVYPDMDEAIKKVSIVIQRHSMDIDGKERNSWIPLCYLQIGIAQFYKHDTWTAIESFQYVSAQYRNEPVRYEALLWLTQCYLRLGKMPDAEYLLSTLEADQAMPASQKEFYNAIYTDYYLLQRDYENAAIHLEKASSLTKKRQTRNRYNFILGQIYQKIGECPKAVTKYEKVMKSNPAYEMAFNAKVSRASCLDPNSEEGKQITKMLEKMLKDEKNVEYKDQIYYALAEIALKENNVPDAVYLLKQSTANSVSNTNQKALSYLKLAEIYFKLPDYKQAQMFYDSTATFISEDHPDYYSIINIRNNLTKLIQNLNIIQVQDSLLALGALSEAERVAVIDRRLSEEAAEKARILEEKKAREAAEKEKEQYNPGEGSGGVGNSLNNSQSSSSWYFSNPSTVSFGFNEFIKLWGNRKLEDNWRRSNKSSFEEATSTGGDEFELDTVQYVDNFARDSAMAAQREKKKKAYLEAVPVTAEQKAQSEAKIVEAYYNVGLIYKEQLKDYKESKVNFETLLERYPENQYKLPTMYNLYRVYLALDDPEKSDYYKNIILNDYPDSEYAKIILNPDYFKDQERKVAIQKVFYENTYRAYLNKQYEDVIERKEMADSLFPGSDLAPKFSFLKSLAIGESRPIAEFEASLKAVIVSFPDDSVSVRAREILSLINPAMYDRKDSTETKDSTGTSNVVTPPMQVTPFTFNADTIQYMLIFFPNNNVIGSNELKVAVSNYNTKYYSVKNLSINSAFLGTEYQFLMVRQFTNKDDGLRYLDGLLSDPEALNGIAIESATPALVSPDNMLLLMQSRNLKEYETYYNEHYLK